MNIAVDDPRFKTQKLSIETASLWRGPRLLLNGAPVEGKGSAYVVRDDAGAETAVVVKPGFPDPIPKLLVGGGAVGGLFGALALYVNARIFRSDRGSAAKYGLTALVSAAAVAAFTVLALTLQTLIRGS